jgi:phospholipase C
MGAIMNKYLALSLVSALALAAALRPAFGDPDIQSWRGEFRHEDHDRGERGETKPLVHLQPSATQDVEPFTRGFGEGNVYNEETQERLIRALQKKVKYVFVIFNENRSFDNEYGTLPGVNGLYSDGFRARSAANTLGFTQSYTDASGTTVSVSPFLIGPQQNATFMDSVDHSHTGLARKIHVVGGAPQMDQFAFDEYSTRVGATPTVASKAKATQFARLVMSHVDCDTIPFFWYWATRFTIFDNIFATEDTPSTPNAVAMIAGQAGETQWVKHGAAGATFATGGSVCGTTFGGGTTQGPPLVNDPQPFYGSEFDTTATNKQPAGCKEFYGPTNIASNLTFASLPLSFLGSSATTVTNADLNATFDLADVKNDIAYLTWRGGKPVSWRWYQEGYDHEPTDAAGSTSYKSYVSHHQGPQYFGYVANNPQMNVNLRGLGDFFADVSNGNLPQSGVMYIRGGFSNIAGLTPPVQNKDYPAAGALDVTTPAGLTNYNAVKATKSGDDNHPGYTDHHISEAMAARIINAIASNEELWSQSAIVITYDESDGFYDHVPPHIQSYGPDGLPLSRGVRVPLLLISPYAHAHAVSSAEGDHNAVIETINAIFGLPALASLPDEKQALQDGNSPAFNQFAPAGFEQKALGPRDLPTQHSQSLLSGFDLARLEGRKAPLPASLAKLPDTVVNTLPHFGGTWGGACHAIGVVPEDRRQGIQTTIPAGFNTLPSTLPAFN